MAGRGTALEHRGTRFKEPVMLNLLTCLPWFKPHTAVRRSARITWPEDGPAADDERPLGCGWFDSSHELERGLQVR